MYSKIGGIEIGTEKLESFVDLLCGRIDTSWIFALERSMSPMMREEKSKSFNMHPQDTRSHDNSPEVKEEVAAK